MAQGDPKVSTTRQNNPAATEDRVAAKRTVTYIFNTSATSSTLSIPYAVAVDDEVQAAYRNSVARVSGGDGAITVTVNSGQKVSLFLNSDAAPGRRKNAVYAVTPKDRNVRVTVKEKKGKHNDPDTPVLVATEKALEKYNAPLTGDIWMKVTHKFTAADVDAAVPAGTRAEIIAALRILYGGLTGNTLTLTIPASGTQAAFTTTLTFADADNPRDNITSFSLTTDGLPRVHPAGFAAILKAAVDSSVTAISMSSNWRPCLGSIAHRAGLGVDVNNVGGTRMFRTAGANATEVRLLQAFQAKPTDANKAAYEAERDKNQPLHVQGFRRSLQQNPGVKQCFDPWEMDSNTRDNQAATPNRQNDGNSKLHGNHLHITARDGVIIA
ncbi:hypothetical protein [Polyangium fumosum]|uniref:Uncharacterized protein n=1 Tax=Polyangium fumosum TaxID=889272 RepID=A0A4U1IQB7_9BACT|nr:hypothetical protein [Polyangium fumosum]TKC96390.1 hypothetical protein E8A74_45615 [Polyangium fumosum]